MAHDTPVSESQPPATTHRDMWALGDYPAMAAEVLAPLGPILVSASGVRPGDRVLDVAAGTGNAAIAAALAGAHVVASDLTPKLLRRAQQRAEAAGLKLGWREADADAPGGVVGPRRLYQRPVQRLRLRRPYAARIAAGGPVRPPRRVRRVLQGVLGVLRPGDQRLPQHRRRPESRRPAGCRTQRTQPRILHRRRDGVGVPDFHRAEAVTAG